MANEFDPHEWVKDMRRVVDDKLVKQLVEDFRSYNPSPRSLSPPATVQVVGAGRVAEPDPGVAHRPANATNSGWTEPPKVNDWKPPGVEHMDRMMDEQDRLDRAARIRMLGMAQHSLTLAEAAREAEAKEAELAKQPEPKERKDKGPQK
jgi:hypothetical protein